MGIHSSRVKYVGNYTAHECDIEVSNVTSEDSGVWSCEVESYGLNACTRKSGYKAKKELNLMVKSLTTTTTTKDFRAALVRATAKPGKSLSTTGKL